MTPRVASGVLVSALIRAAEGEGGFGAVLAKGDASAGAILLILLERGASPRVLQRVLQGDGSYRWMARIGQGTDNPQEVPGLIARERRFDPDLWVLELDVPQAERFAAAMTAFD